MNRGRYARLWQLTEREEEVLALVAEGLSNHEIAARFGISERTVRQHCSNILSKLGVSNRTAAAVQVWREQVAELEAENAQLRAEQWQPCEGGRVAGYETVVAGIAMSLTLSFDGDVLTVTEHRSWIDGEPMGEDCLNFTLPDNVRLCKRGE